MAETRTSRLILPQWSDAAADGPSMGDFNEAFQNIETLAAMAQQGTLAQRDAAGHKTGRVWTVTGDAVGANGAVYYDNGVTWIPVAGAVQTGRRNVVCNGDMSVAQETDGPYTAVGYTLDQWKLLFVGGTAAVDRVRDTPLVGEGRHYMRATASGQAATNNYFAVESITEDVRTLAGREVTLSFDAWASSGTPQLALAYMQNFGTGGSAAVNGAVSPVTLSTTPQRYALTFTLPSVAGKTLGSGSTGYLALRFLMSAGSTSTFASLSSGIGIQNYTLNITDVQLEAGPVATPFERLPLHEQLSWCQRYMTRINVTQNRALAMGQVISATLVRAYVQLPVPLRAAFSTATAWDDPGTGTWVATKADGTDTVGYSGVFDVFYCHPTLALFEFTFPAGTGLTAGHATTIKATGTGAHVVVAPQL